MIGFNTLGILLIFTNSLKSKKSTRSSDIKLTILKDNRFAYSITPLKNWKAKIR